jgi:ubiquinone/menaquinone biosynthesis C-methylase UbiE
MSRNRTPFAIETAKSSPLAPIPEKTRDYPLGYSEQEEQRLIMQAQLLRDWTERFFRASGLDQLGGQSARVLDIGCGMGDVAMLAADLVGPGVTVVAIDRDSPSVEKARARAVRLGYGDRIVFRHADIAEFESEEKFDAIVGRYILPYLRQPAASLRQMATLVKPAGLMVFHEIDVGGVPRMEGAPALYSWAFTLLGEAFRRGGADPSSGLKLAPAFLDAGLGWPKVVAEVPVGGEPGSYLFPWLSATIKNIQPVIEKSGLATAAELDIDTLPARLEKACAEARAQVIGPTQFGAWVRV